MEKEKTDEDEQMNDKDKKVEWKTKFYLNEELINEEEAKKNWKQEKWKSKKSFCES